MEDDAPTSAAEPADEHTFPPGGRSTAAHDLARFLNLQGLQNRDGRLQRRAFRRRQCELHPLAVPVFKPAASFSRQDFGLARAEAMASRNALSSARPVIPECRDRVVDLRL